MRFTSKRLKYLYFAIKLAVIAVIGAVMSYAAQLVFWRMLGGQASIGVLSAFVGGVCGAILLAAAVFAILWGAERKKDVPKPSIAEAEALFCVKTCVPLAAGKEIDEIAKEGDAGGVLCLQSTLLIATAVQFLALIVRKSLTATTWVSLALAALLAVTIVVGQVKRVKRQPLDADALVRKLAEYRTLFPKPQKRKKGDGAQSASESTGENSPENDAKDRSGDDRGGDGRSR